MAGRVEPEQPHAQQRPPRQVERTLDLSTELRRDRRIRRTVVMLRASRKASSSGASARASAASCTGWAQLGLGHPRRRHLALIPPRAALALGLAPETAGSGRSGIRGRRLPWCRTIS